LSEEDSSLLCVQVDLTGAVTNTFSFSTRQPDSMESCATRDAIPFGPTVTVMGTVDPQSGAPVREMWADPVSLAPVVGEDNLYEIVNYTVDAHPMHLHGARFKVVDRQALATNPDGSVALPLTVIGTPIAPAANEAGYKDTVGAPPAMVTRIRAAFAQPGLYQFHCHIVEHEDNEMMIPLCAKGAESDTACAVTPGGVPWPILNNGAGAP
jgi:FtsP/CotA-like multicopper oxidase with cupredoxin domain